MISEYHRPKKMAQALALLARPEPLTLPLGGGTKLNRPNPQRFAVVDVQDLGMDTVEVQGNRLMLGAALTLERLAALASDPGAFSLPVSIKKDLGALGGALRSELNANLRRMATVAGTLAAADGRSALAAALLALDVELVLLPGEHTVSLGEALALRGQTLRGKLIRWVSLPINARLAYEVVCRTPDDFPLVCAAVAGWDERRSTPRRSTPRWRSVLGGYGEAPMLVFDGAEVSGPGAELAAGSAYAGAGDEWASAQYRGEMAALLVRRCLQRLGSGVG